MKLFKLAGLLLTFILGSLLLVGAGPQDDSKQSGKKEDIKGDAARGKLIFKDHCTACHEVSDKDDKIGPGLKGISKKGPHTLADGTVHAVHGSAALRKMVVEGTGAMGPISSYASLSEKELNDLFAYVLTL